MSEYYLFEPERQSFEEFISEILISGNINRCDTSKFTAEALQGLVNPDFDNILYCQSKSKETKGYEIEIKYRRNNYYEFITKTIPKKIDIRFGCELETCFVLNCRKDVKDEIERILQGEDIKNNKNGGRKWQKLIYYHLRNNIIPYLTEDFTEKFRFAYIYPGYHSESGFFIDMKNGNVVNKNLNDEGYRTLIFEPDGSIKCDNGESKDSNGNVYDSIPIPCEIVTPVLSSIDDLKLLYKGLLPKIEGSPCNQSNSSMGFHVNVSAVNQSNGKIVELTRGMFAELINKWIPYEKKHYKSLRGEGSRYAIKLQDYLNNNESIISIKEIAVQKNGEDIGISDLYKPYGISLWYITNVVNNEKFLSMTHHKQNNVIEFRVFNSSTDIDKLINYTQDAIDVFKGALESYCNKPNETIIQIQKNNLEFKYTPLKIPFKEIKGDYLYITKFVEERGDFKFRFGFADKKGLFGFKNIRDYFPGMYHGHLKENVKYDTYKIIIEFEEELYYIYNFVYNIDSDIYLINNPIKISKEEYEIYKNEFIKSYKFSRYYLN